MSVKIITGPESSQSSSLDGRINSPSTKDALRDVARNEQAIAAVCADRLKAFNAAVGVDRFNLPDLGTKLLDSATQGVLAKGVVDACRIPDKVMTKLGPVQLACTLIFGQKQV